ncbi:MAG TPA: molybdopterin cofactor-binding domain-containing protein [Vicinamibacteria bacterium]|nr:molybdopterin cofactor-binding domain-containing protein [Vicinamibacteria bacterium]
MREPPGDLDRRMDEPFGELQRRTFLQALGSGLLVTVAAPKAWAEGTPVSARVFLNEDGTITALSGKVEEGQGPRAELTQAAAEELRVPVERVRLVMADTDLVPDDGITAGSRTTPANVPEMRRAAATARELLTALAAREWKAEPATLKVQDGVLTGPAGRTMTYGDLARVKDAKAALGESIRPDVTLTPVGGWKALGQPVLRPNARDLVTGAHRFPSDIVRPGMLYGRVLRPPAYGATLDSIDLSAARSMPGVAAVREGSFVGFAAPSSYRAAQAMLAAERTASWKSAPKPVSNENLFEHLRAHARRAEARVDETGSVDAALGKADRVLTESYHVAFIQHAPMEPRAALAEWSGDRLTVWAGGDGPFRAQQTLAEALGIPRDRVHVIVPDMGGGFGGKHTADAAVEAARLARAAGKPVCVRWTREEEFTWAYCRPAALIECRGGLDAKGALVAWEFNSINPGGAAVGTPYAIPHVKIASIGSDSPLPQGSYRCLGATANNFARESFMDELAAAAGADALEFRLAHLDNRRLRAVLEKAAREFGWVARRKQVTPERGVGLACGTEKNSVVTACVEVRLDRSKGRIEVTEICEAFECGPVLNPANLLSQVQGCIVMALGGALTEELEFRDGRILNPRFSRYRVPRFRDVPRIDVHLVENRDVPSAGGGETPIIAAAPAIANAVFAATGVRLRSMPLRGEALAKS